MNSIIVDGEDSFTSWGLILTGAELEPPTPKTALIDVPGGNGSIDLTEALIGDTAYSDRKQTFHFAAVRSDDLEAIKTRLSNRLHGRRFDYRLSWDEGYTYTGRFAVASYVMAPGLLTLDLQVTADPYKRRELMTYRLNAVGGRMYRFECGRKRVQPTIECTQPAKVSYAGREIQLGVGTWRLNDVVFSQGWNALYIISHDMKTVTWGELAQGGARAMTWEMAREKRWYDVFMLAAPEGDVAPTTWAGLFGSRWSELATKKWSELQYRDATGEDYMTYLSYDWSDL